MAEPETSQAHCVVFPWPIQGHINPMLQFAKRLHAKGVHVTLLLTNFLTKSNPNPVSFAIETYTDGFDDGVPPGFTHEDTSQKLLEVGPASVKEALLRIINGIPTSHQNNFGRIGFVYDSYLPWGFDIAEDLGLVAAPFFTQSCAVSYLYHLASVGKLAAPVLEKCTEVVVPGVAAPLVARDLPSFLTGHVPFRTIFELALEQFRDLEKVDWMIINTFYESEPELIEYMKKFTKVATIGPTVPSMYLDRQLPDDRNYGLNLYKSETAICLEWMSQREPGSVVYVSFGSVSAVDDAQMKELAWGLKLTNKPFLWVVRSSEKSKVPEEFINELSETALIVTWCPQLDVLAHPAVGCFISHCGWNSTLEAVSMGVPMVAMPQWTDQPTNAKFVAEIWNVGVRVLAEENGVVDRMTIKRGVEEVMDGEKGEIIRKNSGEWKSLAVAAMHAGGSSDRSIDEFIACCTSFKSPREINN